MRARLSGISFLYAWWYLKLLGSSWCYLNWYWASDVRGLCILVIRYWTYVISCVTVLDSNLVVINLRM